MGNLNQSEIDALLDSLAGGAEAPAGGDGGDLSGQRRSIPAFEPVLDDEDEELYSPIHQRNYRLYDFRRPEKLSKDQARQLRTHFGLFWRRVANYLANLSRSSVEVELVEVDQTTYKEIFTTHGVPSVMSTFLLADEFQGMMKLNLSQIFSLVDRLMGGSGICSLRPRGLTDFERNLCIEIFGQMTSFYAGICGDWKCQVENVETDERLLPRKLSGDEMMIRAIYDLRFGSVGGYLNLYVPLKSLSSVLGGAAKGVSVNRQTQTEELPPMVSRMKLPVSVILGETRMNAESVARLQPGSIVQLRQEEHRPLKVTIGNQVRFLARPGLVGNRLAVSITDLWEAM